MNTVTKFAFGAATAIVATATMAVPAFAETHTVKWNGVQGASSYNIYYSQSGKHEWQYSVPNVPSTSTSYKIKGLSDGVSYKYVVRSVWNGMESTVKKGSFTAPR